MSWKYRLWVQKRHTNANKSHYSDGTWTPWQLKPCQLNSNSLLCSKETSKLYITGLLCEETPVMYEFPCKWPVSVSVSLAHVRVEKNSLNNNNMHLRSWSTLAQVMAKCLTAPSHYLNQCLLIISQVQWHSSEGNFSRDTSVINQQN